MKKLFAPLLLLCALAAPAQAVDDNLVCYVGGQLKPCPDGAKLKPTKLIALANIPALDVSHLPTGIPAPNIGTGAVDNTIFGYLSDVTGPLQAQLNLKLAINGDASSLTNIPAAQLAGNVARARISTALAAGGDPVTGTVVTASSRTETPTIGTAAGAQHALPAGTAALLAADSALPAANLTGDIARARMSTGLAAGGDPVAGTVLTAASRVDTPTVGTSSGTQHALPSGTTPLLSEDSTATVTGKSMSGASNTFTNLPGPDWGDGSDGAQVISGTTTLTQSLHATTIVVQSGGILNTGNVAVYATTSIIVQNGGIIRNNGAAASGSTGGVATTSRFYFPPPAGVNGQLLVGSNGTNTTLSLGGSGGAGGAGVSGAGGTGGTATASTADAAAYKTLFSRENLFVGFPSNPNRITNGASGGSGGGSTIAAGGGSGTGGGTVMLKSPLIQVDVGGVIQANGGDGAAGTATNTGGGGGGGGGIVSLLYRSLVENGTIQAAGGAGGASGGGGGAAGSAGSVGQVLRRALP